MPDRELRRRCETLLDDLNIPTGADIMELCRIVARRQRKPIHISGESLPIEGPCGFAVRTDRFDVIFYERDTSLLHQQLIISHELGHILCDHRMIPVMDPDASRLLPNVPLTISAGRSEGMT